MACKLSSSRVSIVFHEVAVIFSASVVQFSSKQQASLGSDRSVSYSSGRSFCDSRMVEDCISAGFSSSTIDGVESFTCLE